MSKPAEPPAGIAKLSGALRDHGIRHHVFDASLEGLLHLLELPQPKTTSESSWSRRAFRNCGRNMEALRHESIYRNIDKYKRAVKDLGRVLSDLAPPGTALGLSDYSDSSLSPLKSGDLLISAEYPERNPFFPSFSSRLREHFSTSSYSYAGISLNYLSQALTAFSIAGFIRREFPETKIVLGGGLVTSWLSNPGWDNPFSGLIDHMVAGPGEYPLLSILGIKNPKTHTSIPEYSSLCLSYLSPGFVLPYSASSGCYWNRCRFCPEEAEGNLYHAISPSDVIDGLKVLKDETSPALLHLMDNAISPALLQKLSDSPPGIPWYGFARISDRLTDPDFCFSLKRAGCIMLKLGIESGDQQVLDMLDKGIKIETASRVLRNLRRAGIASYVYLLFGTPVETEAEARRTLEFTASHADCISFLNLAIFNMPRFGKSVFESETRRFSEGDLSLYTDFIHPRGWDRKKVRLFLDREFKRHPAVSAILKQEVPVFTSNHAPFFVGTLYKQ